MKSSIAPRPLSVAVIGAGISGLSCARSLTARGVAVTIFEKSRSRGGRCATRKWENHIVDHGAQYFTLRDAAFRDEIEALCGGELRTLEAPFLDREGREIPAVSPRWYHAQGNNRLGKALSAGLTLRMEATVGQVEAGPGGWTVDGEVFDAVVSSAPLPQSLALIGRVEERPSFAACLTAFFAYEGEWAGNSRETYARPNPGDDLAWSACENHKAGRIMPGRTVFVVQASPAFSARHLENDPASWAASLRERLEERWELSAAARQGTFTHRWRYARYLGEEPICGDDLPPGFWITGDARSESRVESAWLAGRAAAGAILAGNQRQ